MSPIDLLDVLYKERTFLLYEVYITTIATVFGIIAAMMAIVNTASNPTEQICHIPGLYLYNGIALFSTLVAIVTWMVQFYLKLTHNVLTYKDREKNWVSEGRAEFAYSFWLAVIAAVVFIINIIIINIANAEPGRIRHQTKSVGKPWKADNGKYNVDTMLY